MVVNGRSEVMWQFVKDKRKVVVLQGSPEFVQALLGIHRASWHFDSLAVWPWGLPQWALEQWQEHQVSALQLVGHNTSQRHLVSAGEAPVVLVPHFP